MTDREYLASHDVAFGGPFSGYVVRAGAFAAKPFLGEPGILVPFDVDDYLVPPPMKTRRMLVRFADVVTGDPPPGCAG